MRVQRLVCKDSSETRRTPLAPLKVPFRDIHLPQLAAPLYGHGPAVGMILCGCSLCVDVVLTVHCCHLTSAHTWPLHTPSCDCAIVYCAVSRLIAKSVPTRESLVLMENALKCCLSRNWSSTRRSVRIASFPANTAPWRSHSTKCRYI